MKWLGYVGVVALACAWLPQCRETIRAGRTPVNRGYLALASLGGVSMFLYALWKRDLVFASLNAMTSAGALLNAFYSVSPRRPD